VIETKEKEIGGKKWSVTQFPGMEALRLKVALAQTFGPALGALCGKDGGALDMNLAGADFSGVVEALLNHLDEDKAEALVLRLLRSTRIDGQEVSRVTFDMLFVGDYAPHLYAGLKFVLETNYAGFIPALATGFRHVQPAGAKG